ncbi:MAG: hypothetical protein KH897_09750, partial [Bacteroides sp.]|uniref:hypothetical protein n=1 Tax=Bacteroides sp. TaxID=29523 RepID=UPI0025B89B35
FVHHHCNSCTSFSNISSLFSIFEVSTYSVHYSAKLQKSLLIIKLKTGILLCGTSFDKYLFLGG